MQNITVPFLRKNRRKKYSYVFVSYMKSLISQSFPFNRVAASLLWSCSKYSRTLWLSWYKYIKEKEHFWWLFGLKFGTIHAISLWACVFRSLVRFRVNSFRECVVSEAINTCTEWQFKQNNFNNFDTVQRKLHGLDSQRFWALQGQVAWRIFTTELFDHYIYIPGPEIWTSVSHNTSLTFSVMISLGTTRDDRLVCKPSAIHKFQTWKINITKDYDQLTCTSDLILLFKMLIGQVLHIQFWRLGWGGGGGEDALPDNPNNGSGCDCSRIN